MISLEESGVRMHHTNKRRKKEPCYLKFNYSDISKFILGSEAWRNKAKEIILRLSNE